MTPEEINAIDWGKIFLALAMAFVMGIQLYHGSEIRDVKSEIVPRSEYEERHKNTVPKDDIMHKDVIEDELDKLRAQIARLEKE